VGRVFTSARCQLHDPPGFPERPARLEAVLRGAAAAGWERVEVDPQPATRAATEALHSAAYIGRFERALERGDGLLDSADNPLCAGTLEAAWAAVDCALAAADWIAGGDDRQALAAVRPPGHHAERSMAMGFCYLGNIAIAANHLVGHHHLPRVAIFDFDVHHGNGTQHLLSERGEIFFASVHQWPFYPGTGAASERGRGAGLGTTLNVPLPAGTTDAEFQAALVDQAFPAMAEFEPQILLVSAGFDGWIDDPIGGWKLTVESYSWLGAELAAFAQRHCRGRLLSVLEGGYSLTGLEELTAAYLEAGSPAGRI
jgi:acetoin utilization deacetylase AcuC-like enzyme